IVIIPDRLVWCANIHTGHHDCINDVHKSWGWGTRKRACLDRTLDSPGSADSKISNIGGYIISRISRRSTVIHSHHVPEGYIATVGNNEAVSDRGTDYHIRV